MRILSMLIFMIPLIIIGIVYVVVFRQRDSLMDEERFANSLYKDYCGGRFKKFNYTHPYVRIAFYDEFMVASYIRKIYLPYHKIKSFILAEGGHIPGVQITPEADTGIEPFVLWTKSRDRITDILTDKVK